MRFALSDCGCELILPKYSMSHQHIDDGERLIATRIVMIIKAPKGTLTLFEGITDETGQKAIENFMEAHK